MELNREDIVAILNTVRESGYHYFNLEVGDLKVSMGEQAPGHEVNNPDIGAALSKGAVAPNKISESPIELDTKSAAAATSLPEISRQYTITAPIVGVFYQSPTPGETPYVKVGDRVKEGDTVGLIEVMKVYNSVASEVSGIVVDLLVEDNAVVEYGQPLLVVQRDEV